MRSRRLSVREGGPAFLCRYVQRTLAQQGDEAVTLPLVVRHLTYCPACRAARRRILGVDRALQDRLRQEDPPWFDGRWETIRRRIRPDHEQTREEGPVPSFRIRVLAVLFLAALLGAAWLNDRPALPSSPIPEVVPGLTVHEVILSGRKGRVELEPGPGEDGTVYLWVRPETVGPDEDRQR